MRQGQQNRRGRGRNRKGQSPLSRNFESNGPDVKIRGSAAHIAEKYMSLARDAMASGDSIIAENYLQHAEHYNRIIMAAQAQMQPPFDPMNGNNGPRNRPMPGDGGPDDQGDFDGDDQMSHGARDSFSFNGQRDQGPREHGNRDQGYRDQGHREQGHRDQGHRDHGHRDHNRQRFEPRHDAMRQPPGLDEQPVVAPIAVETQGDVPPPMPQEQDHQRAPRQSTADSGFRRERAEGEEGFRGPRRRGRPPGNGPNGERRPDREPRERPPAIKDDGEEGPQS